MILILEDDPARLRRLNAALKVICPTTEVRVWADAKAMVREVSAVLSAARLVSLDHDLLPVEGEDVGDGLDVAKHLVTLDVRAPAIVRSSNEARSSLMVSSLRGAGWTCERVPPIGEDWVESDWVATVRRLLALTE